MSSVHLLVPVVRALACAAMAAALFGCAGPEMVSSAGVLLPPTGGARLAPTLDEQSAVVPIALALHVDEEHPEGGYILQGEYYPEEEYGPEDAPSESVGVGHRLLFWLPNRVFDVLDLVRARVRVGPGWTFSVRVTELADVNMGAHRAFFVGLRGPRHEPMIPWPLGLERFEGVEVSVMDMTDSAEDRGPRYGPLEVGLGFQFLVIGADVGVALWEAVDLLAGVFLFDPVGDDF